MGEINRCLNCNCWHIIMGMMDGGTNFGDICRTCDRKENGGTMRRYKHDRNVKICIDCFEKIRCC